MVMDEPDEAMSEAHKDRDRERNETRVKVRAGEIDEAGLVKKVADGTIEYHEFEQCVGLVAQKASATRSSEGQVERDQGSSNMHSSRSQWDKVGASGTDGPRKGVSFGGLPCKSDAMQDKCLNANKHKDDMCRPADDANVMKKEYPQVKQSGGSCIRTKIGAANGGDKQGGTQVVAAQGEEKNIGEYKHYEGNDGQDHMENKEVVHLLTASGGASGDLYECKEKLGKKDRNNRCRDDESKEY